MTNGASYRQPPKSTRFQKGQSGNPKGRPKGRHISPPYDAVLGQKVTIRENGEERQVTAAEAFILQLTKRGLEGDSAAGRTALIAIEEARSRRRVQRATFTLTTLFVAPGNVNTALRSLRMATKLDPFRETARMALEPWIVEAALARLNRRLSVAEQEKVFRASRTPHKVRWPDWWKVRHVEPLPPSTRTRFSLDGDLPG